MKRLLALALLVAAAFGALSYHFILTRDGLIIERKEALSFEETFVDARPWGILDWAKHPKIAKALAHRGASNLSKSAGEAIEKAGEELEKLGKQMKK